MKKIVLYSVLMLAGAAAIASEINIYRNPMVLNQPINLSLEEKKLISLIREFHNSPLDQNNKEDILNRQLDKTIYDAHTRGKVQINANYIGDTPGI